ncbi:hypothetical protein BJ085DRAFT_39851 [Dimargaris cristalligena]|uniref:Uncharacterized protein n=1 Tax=Dimargaris cristalligena TaxID=215637 RepID=A0A4P9ZMD6_9FUNG|nr:hypothetical protein BJ085DRAFT_39851 [Dimargaris cristalligena]|eukprot:RKP33721.1 hypothetical protein BJ085DRAFT_39851 [Dimargaris cristalligena]
MYNQWSYAILLGLVILVSSIQPISTNLHGDGLIPTPTLPHHPLLTKRDDPKVDSAKMSNSDAGTPGPAGSVKNTTNKSSKTLADVK